MSFKSLDDFRSKMKIVYKNAKNCVYCFSPIDEKWFPYCCEKCVLERYNMNLSRIVNDYSLVKKEKK